MQKQMVIVMANGHPIRQFKDYDYRTLVKYIWALIKLTFVLMYAWTLNNTAIQKHLKDKSDMTWQSSKLFSFFTSLLEMLEFT